jgi:acyl carrier protein
MTEREIRVAIQEELTRIAPDIDFTTVSPRDDIRDAFDIDSMDVLNFVTALHQRLGVDIPEVDYPKLLTVDDAIAYLAKKLNTIRQTQE